MYWHSYQLMQRAVAIPWPYTTGDSLVSATAAVDFGTRKGASTASGMINGMGSIGAIAGGTIPGFFKESWGWEGVFTFLAVSILLAGLLMIPKWNAIPDTAAKSE